MFDKFRVGEAKSLHRFWHNRMFSELAECKLLYWGQTNASWRYAFSCWPCEKDHFIHSHQQGTDSEHECHCTWSRSSGGCLVPDHTVDRVELTQNRCRHTQCWTWVDDDCLCSYNAPVLTSIDKYLKEKVIMFWSKLFDAHSVSNASETVVIGNIVVWLERYWSCCHCLLIYIAPVQVLKSTCDRNTGSLLDLLRSMCSFSCVPKHTATGSNRTLHWYHVILKRISHESTMDSLDFQFAYSIVFFY